MLINSTATCGRRADAGRGIENLAGLFLRERDQLFEMLTPDDGCATRMVGTAATRTIGAKSFTTS